MTRGFIARLDDRGVVSVSGPDAAKLLQGVITNDLETITIDRALFAGLLSPQGKVLFDFIITRKYSAVEGQPDTAEDVYYLDVALDQAPALAKRLAMYKLRANAEIEDESETAQVLAMWGDGPSFNCVLGTPDPRLKDLGLRGIGSKRFVKDDISCSTGAEVSADAYHAHRIALGVPEGGKDYAWAGAFPHEALFDQLNGVSFTKGCYVGQEIVSRMEHRGTARARIVKVGMPGGVPPAGTPVMGGEVAIGSAGSSQGEKGLALVRLDRLADFNDRGIAIKISGAPATLSLQDWVTYALSDYTRTAHL